MKNNIPLLTREWAKARQLPHLFFKETESTNREARTKAFAQSPLLFIAETQTQGKGRNKNIWENSDLMISWLWEQTTDTFSPSLCKDFSFDLLSNAKKIWPELLWEIKEPNDLLLNKKKIAGILLEIIDEAPKKALILGLGFNVFSHPSSLSATHLTEYTSNFSPLLWESFLDLNHKTFTKRLLK